MTRISRLALPLLFLAAGCSLPSLPELVKACKVNSDCLDAGSNFICAAGGVCLPKNFCQENVDCSAGLVCNKDEKDAGTCGLDPNLCVTDAQCGNGKICSKAKSTCVPRCDVPADCMGTGPWACIDNACTQQDRPCEHDTECEAGKKCSARNRCDPICVSDADCGGKVCSAGACVDAPKSCTADSECSTGEKCSNGKCAQTCMGTGHSTCPAGSDCDGTTCVLKPAKCTSNEKCGNAEFCEIPTGQSEGACVDTCMTPNHCVSGLTCVFGQCKPPPAGCVDNSGCNSDRWISRAVVC